VAELESRTWGREGGGGQIYQKKKFDMGAKLGACQQMAQFFANVFGGERFNDDYMHFSPCPYTPTNTLSTQIGEISLMKDMMSVTNTMLSEEEKEKAEATELMALTPAPALPDPPLPRQPPLPQTHT
jgi:hypothetical protein